MEIPQRAQRGVLHDVLSVVIVARQVARQRMRSVQMRQHDGFESLELARLQPVLGVGGPPVDRDSACGKNIPGGISTRGARSDRLESKLHPFNEEGCYEPRVEWCLVGNGSRHGAARRGATTASGCCVYSEREEFGGQ